MPPPVPPRVKLGRMIAGSPTVSSAATASSRLWAIAGARAFQPDAVHRLAELQPVLGLFDRFGVGADHLDAVFAPACRPWLSASAVLSAVCPPIVGSTASGLSFSMILATTSGVIGSI